MDKFTNKLGGGSSTGNQASNNQQEDYLDKGAYTSIAP